MKKKKIFISVIFIVGITQYLLGNPYQFLKYESAFVIGKKDFEFRFQGFFEQGQIKTNGLYMQARYGITKNIELTFNTYLIRFPEADEIRLASINFGIKSRLHFMDFAGIEFVNYVKLRMALGEPYRELYDGQFDNVQQMVSPYADGGNDLIIGLLGRKKLEKYGLTTGIEYVRASGRDYFDFQDNQKNVFSLQVTPHKNFFKKDKLLLACENKFSYWINRGTMFETIPEIRWELIPKWVFEAGVSLPLYGGKNYQYTFGFTLEY
ncbi:MAG: hypothetical protein JXB49_33730 [Bacteroidales bacterium]|nr:hypothetical protein [Bacteroidales bacterium]